MDSAVISSNAWCLRLTAHRSPQIGRASPWLHLWLMLTLRLPLQNKLVVALREYRILHSQQASQSRSQLPHNLLIYPSTLKFLPLWILGRHMTVDCHLT